MQIYRIIECKSNLTSIPRVHIIEFKSVSDIPYTILYNCDAFVEVHAYHLLYLVINLL